MKWVEFEATMSKARMQRYLVACGNDSKKAMALYRWNIKLSQSMYSVISCFEVSLRNAIDEHYRSKKGANWLRDAAAQGGMFANQNCKTTAYTIYESVVNLDNRYSHNKLVASLGFGFWRYLFGSHQYSAGGSTLLQIFPNKPVSDPTQQYNAKYVFGRLAKLNELRNRIAHHEPICFEIGAATKSTAYSRSHYGEIIMLFQWLNIDEGSLLYGIDKVTAICDKIDTL